MTGDKKCQLFFAHKKSLFLNDLQSTFFLLTKMVGQKK